MKIEQLERDIKNLKTLLQVDKDEVLTLEGIAAYLKISKTSAYRMCKRGDIPATRKVGDYRIMKSKLIEWFNSK